MRPKYHAKFIKTGSDIRFVGKDGTHQLDEMSALAVHHRGKQVFLIGEVDVKRAFGDAGLTGNVVHARRVKPHLHEDALGAL